MNRWRRLASAAAATGLVLVCIPPARGPADGEIATGDGAARRAAEMRLLRHEAECTAQALSRGADTHHAVGGCLARAHHHLVGFLTDCMAGDAAPSPGPPSPNRASSAAPPSSAPSSAPPPAAQVLRDWELCLMSSEDLG